METHDCLVLLRLYLYELFGLCVPRVRLGSQTSVRRPSAS
ncbi:hypothetical protein STANM309S_00389 [Streptomyces tanashiensis]